MIQTFNTIEKGIRVNSKGDKSWENTYFFASGCKKHNNKTTKSLDICFYYFKFILSFYLFFLRLYLSECLFVLLHPCLLLGSNFYSFCLFFNFVSHFFWYLPFSFLFTDALIVKYPKDFVQRVSLIILILLVAGNVVQKFKERLNVGEKCSQ